MAYAEAPTRKLLHGATMPMIGLGTYPLLGAESAAQVVTAIESGYRLIDTAEAYGNEDGVGQGIRQSGIDRAEMFVTTKFDRQWHSVDGVAQACEASLARLGLDYIDLLLVHWPNPDADRYVEAVRGLGRLHEQGRLRAFGTSNFKPAHLARVLAETGLVPDVNQIQLSPYSTRDATRAYHDEHGIATESWSPLGASDSGLRNNPLITEIGQRHDVSATQVVLRWHVQLGLIAIPKSASPVRMAENIAVFHFELSQAELDAISALDRGEADLTDSDVFGH